MGKSGDPLDEQVLGDGDDVVKVDPTLMWQAIVFVERDFDGYAPVGTRDWCHGHAIADRYDPVPGEDQDGMTVLVAGDGRPPDLSSG